MLLICQPLHKGEIITIVDTTIEVKIKIENIYKPPRILIEKTVYRNTRESRRTTIAIVLSITMENLKFLVTNKNVKEVS